VTAHLVAAFLILHGAGGLAETDDSAAVAVAWFGELGLQRAFTDFVRGIAPEAEAGEISLLLKIMLSRQQFFAGWNDADAAERCTLLCADRDVRRFMGVHTYQQQEWFVKERFEFLLEQLWTVNEILSGSEVSDVQRQLHREELHCLLRAAAGAGYRLDRFLARVGGDDGPEKTAGADALTL
jgi:hypothetical protein